MALCTGAMFDLKIGGGSCSLVIFIDAAQPRNKSTAHLNIAMVEEGRIRISRFEI